MKALTVEKKMTKEQVTKLVANAEVSKSQKIRDLFTGGFETKEIAEMVGVRYNFVYNVLQNHVIMNDIQVETVKRDSKRDDIVKLINEGKSLADVSRATKTNYNYIWKISKELKAEQETKKEEKAQ
jgi:DNA invertase Pin-like site-specific DNA recombinase